MALNRATRYPGRFNAVTSESPQGSFKNRTSPTAEDGSYFEADWANDWDGFFARILNVAGVTPNGSVDTGSSSQLYDALINYVPGRLINRTVFTASGLFTPLANTKLLIVEVQGAGGGGGSAIATASGTMSAGSGGGAGGYSMGYLTTIPTSQSVVVGTGGSAASSGGLSSFGSIVGMGGNGGGNSGSSTIPDNTIRQYVGGAGAIGTGGSINLRGDNGGSTLLTTSGNLIGGAGGRSWFSSTGIPPSGSTGAGITGILGSGGTGAISSGGGAAQTGGSGGTGLVIVWEYS